MTLTTPSSAPPSAPPPGNAMPKAAAASGSTDPSDAGGFAQVLQQAQTGPGPMASQETAKVPRSTTAADGNKAAKKSTQGKDKAPAQDDGAAGGTEQADADNAPHQPARAKTAKGADADDGGDAAAGALPPPDAPPPTQPRASARGARTTGGAAEPDGASRTAAGTRGSTDDVTQMAAAGHRPGLEGGGLGTDRKIGFAATLDTASRVHPQSDGAPAVPGAGLTAVGTAAALAGAATPAAAAESARLASPLHSPGFAPELGAQLQLMIKGGQHEARLHLNPADMGPIQVRIQIDGIQARVDMLAEQAPTRHALEQAMPVLAGALRDSGLTLTGGGVFQQPRDPRQPAGRRAAAGVSGMRGGQGDGSEADVARQAMDPLGGAGRARGVLDLYA